MIDLHCHLLPGIDDGPDTLEQALELAQIAVSNGIQSAVVTPHVHPGRYENTAQSIAIEVEKFRDALAEANIDLNIAAAGEVRLSAEILAMFAQQQLPFLGEWQGQQVMLLELPHSHVPPGSDKLVKWLMDRGIRPMIAHPERNKGMMRELDQIKPFVELGCLFQLTAGSVAGSLGPAAELVAQHILEMGVVTILASDAHNAKHRPPNLEPGRRVVERLLGESVSWDMVKNNPGDISKSKFSLLVTPV